MSQQCACPRMREGTEWYLGMPRGTAGAGRKRADLAGTHSVPRASLPAVFSTAAQAAVSLMSIEHIPNDHLQHPPPMHLPPFVHA